eukprot:g11663.t1
MKLIGSSIFAALAQRKSTLINAGVGFSTFAVGDAISQGARPRPQVLPDERRRRQQQQLAEPSWGQQLVGELRQRTSGVDLARSAKVGLLGIFLNGFALGAWYRVLDRYIGSDRTRIQQVLKKCVIDQFVYAPFSITSFVGYAAVLNGGGPANVLANTKTSLADHGLETWIMDWKVWPAANVIMFRFIPSSYRPSFASLVQVAWQAYMSSVSYDNPHHHANPSPAKATIKAGNSAGVLVRGGGRGGGGAGVVAPDGVAANGTGGDGVRTAGGERIIPSPGSPVAVAPINGGTARRAVMVDRRSTGRYAYTSTPSSTGAAGGRGGVPSSGALNDDGDISDGGGGGGMCVVGVSRTPSTPSSPLLSKAKEL